MNNSRESASTQPRPHRDELRSGGDVAPSNRLPRLRRCRCCNKWRKPPGHTISYKWVEGAGIYRQNMLEPNPPGNLDWELMRVTTFPAAFEQYVTGGGQNYEVIRGGRWVDWWNGLYGNHKHETRNWERRNVPRRICEGAR